MRFCFPPSTIIDYLYTGCKGAPDVIVRSSRSTAPTVCSAVPKSSLSMGAERLGATDNLLFSGSGLYPVETIQGFFAQGRLASNWHQESRAGTQLTLPHRVFPLQIRTKKGADERTRTADLTSLRVIIRCCRGLHDVANPVYLSGFLFSALPRVAPYCVRLASVPNTGSGTSLSNYLKRDKRYWRRCQSRMQATLIKPR